VSTSSFVQENKNIVLSIKNSKENTAILLFKVENKTDHPIISGAFNDSPENWIVIKNPQGRDITYHIYHGRNSIKVPPKSSLQWEFDLNKFFHPTGMPRRWADNEGEYEIYWEFNDLVSEVYIYDYYSK